VSTMPIFDSKHGALYPMVSSKIPNKFQTDLRPCDRREPWPEDSRAVVWAPEALDDRMDSFFLAETLKYLYLMLRPRAGAVRWGGRGGVGRGSLMRRTRAFTANAHRKLEGLRAPPPFAFAWMTPPHRGPLTAGAPAMRSASPRAPPDMVVRFVGFDPIFFNFPECKPTTSMC